VEANRRQLVDAGVCCENIDAGALYVMHNTEQLFSFRAEKGP